MATKRWGKKEFWGIGPEFDIDWNLNSTQITLRDSLIDLCKRKIRPNAVKSDKTYEFPHESLQAMNRELGLMGLIIPKEFGGLGQDHVCLSMVMETLARYGCPSTAMVYAMHSQAVSFLLYRYHTNEEIQDLLRRICKDGWIGTSAFSDPATGGHFWFPLSSKAQKISDDLYKLFRFNSWTTSAGFADFYVFQTPTPEKVRDHSDLTTFFVLKEEIRASTDNWSSLGLHGNQSGPVVYEGILNKSRMIGNPGEGQKLNDEVAATFFLICTSSVWNGIALGALDLAKKHATLKTHGDTGMSVAEYPVIQDYVGGSLMETNSCRAFILSILRRLDEVTERNDWTKHQQPDHNPRSAYLMWLMQVKYTCSENVSRVTDKMLKVCGGDGYKTDLGLERLLRDSKAGCVMAPTNEVIKNIIGKASLIGFSSLDLWSKQYSEKTIHNEVKKMTLKEKMNLIAEISEDIEREKEFSSAQGSHGSRYQDSDFDNPFNTSPPRCFENYKTSDGIEHKGALNPGKWVGLKLVSRREINESMTVYKFALPNSTDHSGCFPGQYIQVRVEKEGKCHERYFSPISAPNRFGELEILLKFETHGILSNIFKTLQKGDTLEFRGPCGGLEYQSGELDEVTVIASGSGVTPGLQLGESVSRNPMDKSKISILYYAKDVEEAACVSELEITAEKDPRICLVTTIGDAPEEWQKEEGYLDMGMIDRYVTKPNGLKHKIVLCGGPSMTISCLYSLRALKFPPEMIFIYGPFGTEQIKMVYGRNAKLSGHTCSPEL